MDAILSREIPEARGIPEGPLPDAFEREIVASARTRYGVAERHNYRFMRPQDTVFRSNRGFLDLALSHRPKNATGAFIDQPGFDRQALGDIMYIPPERQLHSQWDMGRQSSVCCAFDFSADDREMLGWSPSELEAALDIRSVGLRALMEKLAAELEEPGFASDLLVEALSIEIGVELGRYLRAARTAIPAGGVLSRGQMKQIEDRIESAGTLPSVNDLAAACGISPRHFFRLFRNTTQMTLTDFAAERRLARAKTLLADRSVLIKEISWRCGFSSSASFSAAFRQATGVTPREYRLSVTS